MHLRQDIECRREFYESLFTTYKADESGAVPCSDVFCLLEKAGCALDSGSKLHLARQLCEHGDTISLHQLVKLTLRAPTGNLPDAPPSPRSSGKDKAKRTSKVIAVQTLISHSPTAKGRQAPSLSPRPPASSRQSMSPNLTRRSRSLSNPTSPADSPVASSAPSVTSARKGSSPLLLKRGSLTSKQPKAPSSPSAAAAPVTTAEADDDAKRRPSLLSMRRQSVAATTPERPMLRPADADAPLAEAPPTDARSIRMSKRRTKVAISPNLHNIRVFSSDVSDKPIGTVQLSEVAPEPTPPPAETLETISEEMEQHAEQSHPAADAPLEPVKRARRRGKGVATMNLNTIHMLAAAAAEEKAHFSEQDSDKKDDDAEVKAAPPAEPESARAQSRTEHAPLAERAPSAQANRRSTRRSTKVFISSSRQTVEVLDGEQAVGDRMKTDLWVTATSPSNRNSAPDSARRLVSSSLPVSPADARGRPRNVSSAPTRASAPLNKFFAQNTARAHSQPKSKKQVIVPEPRPRAVPRSCPVSRAASPRESRKPSLSSLRPQVVSITPVLRPQRRARATPPAEADWSHFVSVPDPSRARAASYLERVMAHRSEDLVEERHSGVCLRASDPLRPVLTFEREPPSAVPVVLSNPLSDAAMRLRFRK